MTKTYSSKSNAIRGFRSLHADIAEGNDNAWIAEHFIRCGNDGQGGSAVLWSIDQDAVQEYEADQDEPEGDEEPTAELDDEGVDVETDVPVQPLREIKGTGAYKDVPLRRRTTDGGAVNWAWSVFDRMEAKGASRKEAIAEAVRVGIAFYTARTQYQKWLHRNDPKPEGK